MQPIYVHLNQNKHNSPLQTLSISLSCLGQLARVLGAASLLQRNAHMVAFAICKNT
jgi:hypothetical protein